MGSNHYYAYQNGILTSKTLDICSSPQKVPSTPKKDPVVFKREVNGVTFEVKITDICYEKVDAISNSSI